MSYAPNTPPYFAGMSHSAAADALAHYEGELQALDEARDDYAEQYVIDTLAELKRDPMGYHRSETPWQMFSQHQADHCDPLNKPLSRALVWMARADDQAIDDLRGVSSDLADAALLIRDNIRNLLHTEGAEEFDEKAKKGPEVDCD